jgi:hypothetical protein
LLLGNHSDRRHITPSKSHHFRSWKVGDVVTNSNSTISGVVTATMIATLVRCAAHVTSFIWRRQWRILLKSLQRSKPDRWMLIVLLLNASSSMCLDSSATNWARRSNFAVNSPLSLCHECSMFYIYPPWPLHPHSHTHSHHHPSHTHTHLINVQCNLHKSQACVNRNRHALMFSKGKTGVIRQWMHWPNLSYFRMWHLLRTGQNISQAPWALDRLHWFVRCTSVQAINNLINQSIDQSINQSISLLVNLSIK